MDIKEMQEMQAELQEKYKDKWGGLSPEKAREKLLWLYGELGEVGDIIKKQGDRRIMEDDTVRGHFIEEMCDVRNIPMMGGYIFYYKERIFGGIYGNGFMVKITEASRKYMPDSTPEPPYDGAKPMLPVTILDDREKLQKMVCEMYPEFPDKKAKKKDKVK